MGDINVSMSKLLNKDGDAISSESINTRSFLLRSKSDVEEALDSVVCLLFGAGDDSNRLALLKLALSLHVPSKCLSGRTLSYSCGVVLYSIGFRGEFNTLTATGVRPNVKCLRGW
jgi:hypothetical protein